MKGRIKNYTGIIKLIFDAVANLHDPRRSDYA